MNTLSGTHGEEPGKRRPRRAADLAALVGLGVVLGAFSLSPVRALLHAYANNPTYSYGILIPVVALILAWRARHRVAAAKAGRGCSGFVPLLAGGGLVVFGHWYQIALRPGYLGHVFLQGMGCLVMLAAIVWILAGRHRFRILLPVLGFLIFAVPWPESFTLPLATALQRGVAICSTHLLRVLGIEVFRDGNLLHLRSTVLGVAEACSGIRSLMAFFATAVACALFLRLNVWHALLLLVLAPVAAVGSNIVRILVTSGLVLLGGDAWLHGPRHEVLGMSVVLLGGGCIFAIAQTLSRSTPQSPESAPADARPASVPPLWPVATVAAVLLLGATLLMGGVTRHYARMVPPDAVVAVPRLPLAEFPYVVGPYRCTDESRLSVKEVDMLQPSEHIVRTYADPQGNWVLLTVLYWEAQRTYPGSSAVVRYPHTPYSCMWGAGWVRETAYDSVTSPDWLPDRKLYAGGFTKAGRERIVLFWNTNVEEDPRPFSPKDLRRRVRLLVQSWNNVPEAILPATYGVRVETDFENHPAHAQQTALDFARQAAALLPDFGIGRRPSVHEPEPD